MNENTCVVFKIGTQKYCASIDKVKEVSGTHDSIYVPGSPDFVTGVINLRDSIVSIIDLAKKLKIDSQNSNKDRPIIIVELKNLLLGFAVDEVLGIIHIQEGEFSETPDILYQRSNFIEGVVRRDHEMTILIDLEKTMSDGEIEQVRTINEEHITQ